MTFLERQNHKRLSLTLALVMLVVYYFVVFRPLEVKEAAQARPFEEVQSRLSAAAKINPAINGLSLESLTQLETELRTALTNAQTARAYIDRRYAPEPALMTNVLRSFQLIDYQNERLNRADQLVNQAAEKKVKVLPAVMAGLPEFALDNANPELLWVQLGLVDGILRAGIAIQVSSLDSVRVPAAVLHPVVNGSRHRLVELPVRVQVTADWNTLTRFLGLVLLNPEERAALKLPPLDRVPGMSVRHILARKVDPNSNAIQLTMEFSGFVRLPVE